VSWGFVLKKIISGLLMPLPLGIFMLLLGLFFLLRSELKRAKITIVVAIIWMGLISHGSVSNALIGALESVYPRLNSIPKGVEYMLILGGDRELRAWEVLRIHQMDPKIKIITSGYSRYEKVSEAEKCAALLAESGIDAGTIMRQDHVKDTQEEAESIRKIVGEKPFVLITSAYHMPRAMRLFEQAGLHPIPAPTNFYPPKPKDYLAIFQAKQLEKTEKAWHEYLGLLWLWLKGDLF